MTFRLLLITILVAAGPVGAQLPVVGPEQALTDVELRPVYGPDQAAVASSGGVVLVAWRDWSGVYGLFLDRDGRPQAPAFAIASGDSDFEGRPSVLVAGTRFYVRWRHRDRFSRLTEVSRDGIPIRTLVLESSVVAAAANSSQILLVLAERFELRAMLVNHDLELQTTIDLGPSIVSSDSALLKAIAVGDDFVLIAPDENLAPGELRMSRLLEGNVGLSIVRIPLGGGEVAASVAGEDLLHLAWPGIYGNGLYTAVLSIDRRIVMPPRLVLDEPQIFIEDSAVLFGAPRILLRSSGVLSLLEMDQSGSLISRVPFLEAGARELLVRGTGPGTPCQIVDVNGEGMALCHSGEAYVATPFASSGHATGPSTAFLQLAADQESHAVASSHDGALVVWIERDRRVATFFGPQTTRLLGRGLDSAGRPSGDIIHFRDGAERPALGWDGSDYVLAWIENREGWYCRISPSGVVGDAKRIEGASPSGDALVLACESGACLLAWTTLNDFAGERRVRGTILDENGARPVFPVSLPAPVLGPDPASDLQYKIQPAIAASPSNFLVTWMDTCCNAYNPSRTARIRGARVSRDGQTLDPAEFGIATADVWQQRPANAWSGKQYLVAYGLSDRNWSPIAPQHHEEQIFARGIDENGSLLSGGESSFGIEISTAERIQHDPSVACRTDADCLIVWSDQRNSTPGALLLDQSDVYGTLVTPEGFVINPAGVAIAKQQEEELNPRVVSLGHGYLVVYQRREYDDGVAGAWKLYTRSVSTQPSRRLRMR